MIASGQVEVRIHTRGTLHAKAYIFDYRVPQPNSHGVGIIGSSNLTEPGLSSNTELNVQVDDAANILTGEGMHHDLCLWFDQLWADAKPFSSELMAELRESWALNVARPYDVYLKMLFELVRSRLEEDHSNIILPEELSLAAYQKVAVHQAIGMVNDYQGAFIADVVGVGKSFVRCCCRPILLRVGTTASPHHLPAFAGRDVEGIQPALAPERRNCSYEYAPRERQ